MPMSFYICMILISSDSISFYLYIILYLYAHVCLLQPARCISSWHRTVLVAPCVAGCSGQQKPHAY